MVRQVLAKRLKNAAGVFGILSYLVLPIISQGVALAAPPVGFTGPSSLSGTTNDPVALSGLQLTGSSSTTTSLQLRVQNGQIELTDTTGVTVTSNNPSSVLSFSGTIANINTALAHVTYTSSNVGSDTLEASTVGEGEVYYPGNGHIYRLVDTGDPEEGGGIDWTDAKAAADAATDQSLTGYLATITSQQENDYVAARLADAGWMGASDSGSEGDWKWVDGPENGTSFWSGDMNGSAVGGNYQNWSGGEPNDSFNNQEADHGEDCAQFLSGGNGMWNDLPCTGAILRSYVIEFGENGDLPTVATKNISINISAAVREVSTCEDLSDIAGDFSHDHDTIRLTADIDCHGVTVEPLFSYNGFYGTFDGQGHTIKNFNIDGINNSYSEGNSAGLFVYTQGATIKDVHLTNGTVSGWHSVGGLIGWAYNTNVENVTSSLTINGQGNDVGGLIGGLQQDTPNLHVSGSSATGDVTGDTHVGGLIGEVSAGGNTSFTIEKSFATGDVTAASYNAGGLISYITAEGWDDPSASITIQDVYAQGDVSTGNSDGNSGGLIGELKVYEDGSPTSVIVRRAYASGSVSGAFNVGGLIGYMRGPDDTDAALSVTSTFAAGEVTSLDPESAGAMVGSYQVNDEPTNWEDNYFDEQRTGLGNCIGSGADLGSCHAINGDGTHSTYFFNNSNAPMNDWDFDDIWVAHANTYPTFDGVQDQGGDDQDGVAPETEAAAPNGGDANGDGQQDSAQNNVTSLIDPVTGKYAVLQSSVCDTNTNVSVSSEGSNSKADSNYTYPAGLMNFTLACPSSGATATVTQIYYGNYDADKYVLRKYNTNNGQYTTVNDAVLTNVTIGGQSALKITYQIADGGPLDQDGTANGYIVDPAGPALKANTGVTGALANTGFGLAIVTILAPAIATGGIAARFWRRTKIS